VKAPCTRTQDCGRRTRPWDRPWWDRDQPARRGPDLARERREFTQRERLTRIQDRALRPRRSQAGGDAAAGDAVRFCAASSGLGGSSQSGSQTATGRSAQRRQAVSSGPLAPPGSQHEALSRSARAEREAKRIRRALGALVGEPDARARQLGRGPAGALARLPARQPAELR
jgi:hypothetical protein